MKIHVVARSRDHGAKFAESHAYLRDVLELEIGQTSYFQLLNRLIWSSDEAYACVVHDDVVLSENFHHRISELISDFNKNGVRWGLVGNAGVSTFRVGYSGDTVIRYLTDPHGGANLQGCVLPVQTIDGNVMLLNLNALREKEVRLPSFEGFHFYDIALSVESQCVKLGVFVAPHLACYHGSGGDGSSFNAVLSSRALVEYLGKKIRNRYFISLNGRVSLPVNIGYAAQACDLEVASIQNAVIAANTRTVAIVVRTKFTRLQLLKRTLSTIEAFVSAAGTATIFECHIISTENAPVGFVFPEGMALKVMEFQSANDDRYLLVEAAVATINADFYWFVDDDDWLFPNEAARLGAIINVAPKNSVFFLDCQHYNERGSEDSVAGFYSAPARYFYARDFIHSFSGFNYTPFCGAIFSKQALRNIHSSVYRSITYYEDFMTLLSTLISGTFMPIVVEKLFVGISIRSTGNTVTENDRGKWNKSMSELISFITNTEQPKSILSFSSIIASQGKASGGALNVDEVNALKQRLEQVLASRSWRITKPLRVAARLFRRDVKFADVARRLRSRK
jgi:GR25 family glycosyltransferase involved in LPS biosynthesis